MHSQGTYQAGLVSEGTLALCELTSGGRWVGDESCLCCIHSDLNWSPFDSNLCATCSADSYVYVWDLR